MIAEMEITRTPVILEGLQRFTSEQATEALWHYLPDRSFDSHSSMVAALSCTFGMSELELHQSILQKFDKSDFDIQTIVANWLNTRGVTRHQYARSIRSANSRVDGLFVWLAVQCAWQHLNLMHASGIWTSRRSEYVVITDPTIVLMISRFLSVTRMDLARWLWLPCSIQGSIWNSTQVHHGSTGFK